MFLIKTDSVMMEETVKKGNMKERAIVARQRKSLIGKLIFVLMIGHVVRATGGPPMLFDDHQEMAVKDEHAERKLTDCNPDEIQFQISTTEMTVPFNRAEEQIVSVSRL